MFTHRLSIKGLAAFLVLGMLASLAGAQSSLGVAEHDEYGSYLVDGDGMSLYVFLPDAEQDEASACYEDCAEAWPPFTPQDEKNQLETSEAVDGELLDWIDRTDGLQQITYDGWPLYYFVQDEEAGDVAGQGVGDNWYLIAPDGTVIGADLEAENGDEGEEADAEAEGGGEMDIEALMAEGETLFNATCAGCHGEDGDETNGAHVARITEAERTVGDPNRLIRRAMYGGAYMPGFADTFSNDEFIAIATYVRNSFGFDEGPVTREEVVEERERFD